MQIVVAGLSHKSAELALREKFALLPFSDIAKKSVNRKEIAIFRNLPERMDAKSKTG